MRLLRGLAGPRGTTALFAGAIVAGALIGALFPPAGTALSGLVDPLILLLVASLFFSLRFESLAGLRRAPVVAAAAISVNFLVIPLIALPLVQLLPSGALRLGVLIYCLAPCTDWFLGFTRLAGGDTATGAALIPVQLSLQLACYPLWLTLLGGRDVSSAAVTTWPALLTWFVLPAGIGCALRLVARLTLAPRVRERAIGAVDRAVPLVIAGVIVGIFAGNIGTVLEDPGAFGRVLVVVFLFFVTTFVLGELVSRALRLEPAPHALLTMTTSARNAPLMLAVTSVALPDQPVVQAAIVLGMLIEFPHLAAITHLLRRSRTRVPSRLTRTDPELRRTGSHGPG